MLLNEVLSEVQTLSRVEKLSLLQVLAQELENDDEILIPLGRTYPVDSLDREFAAAAVLLQALADDKESS